MLQQSSPLACGVRAAGVRLLRARCWRALAACALLALRSARGWPFPSHAVNEDGLAQAALPSHRRGRLPRTRPVLQSSEYFGERSLLADRPSNASVFCTSYAAGVERSHGAPLRWPTIALAMYGRYADLMLFEKEDVKQVRMPVVTDARRISRSLPIRSL